MKGEERGYKQAANYSEQPGQPKTLLPELWEALGRNKGTLFQLRNGLKPVHRMIYSD